jgi:hypothetical protein
LIKYKKACSILEVTVASLRDSKKAEGRKGFFTLRNLRFNKKAKGLIVFAIIAVMLVSIFAFLPKSNIAAPIAPQSSDVPVASPNGTPQRTANPTTTNAPDPWRAIQNAITSIVPGIIPPAPHDPGTIESAQTMDSTVWRAVATNAWNYFQPGTGVDANTGLPRGGGTDAPNFTDWDLGCYVQAVIDAQKIGLIGTDGAWNSSQRLETVVKFLEIRDLNSTTGYPFWFYQASDGKDYRADSDIALYQVDAADTGRLFVALNNLKAFNSSLAQRINNIVYNTYGNRSNYATLVPGLLSESLTSTNIYAYYIISGFASFWPNDLSGAPNRILNNMLSSGNITYNGVWLPKASLLGDPLLYSVFELNNNNPQLMAITKQVYLAHEAYYNSTEDSSGQGQYRAFSEGGTNSAHWAYEWVVLPDGRTWVPLDETGAPYNNSPIIYTKVSIGFLALYNTTFAKNMTVYLESNIPSPMRGYCEGLSEGGEILSGVGVHTNNLILDAALYSIQRNP